MPRLWVWEPKLLVEFRVKLHNILLVIIVLGKILATSISLNFGFFGGVFSPAILVGAGAGAVVSAILVSMVFENFSKL